MEQFTWLKDFGLVGAFAGFILYVARLFGTYIDKRDRESREWMDRFFAKHQEVGNYRMQTGMDHLDRLSAAITALSNTTSSLAKSMERMDQDADRRHEELLTYLRERNHQEK